MQFNGIHNDSPLEFLCIGVCIQLNTHYLANCDHSYYDTPQIYFYLTTFRTNLVKFSNKVQGPVIWNYILLYIQNVRKLYMFEKRLKRDILDN